MVQPISEGHCAQVGETRFLSSSGTSSTISPRLKSRTRAFKLPRFPVEQSRNKLVQTIDIHAVAVYHGRLFLPLADPPIAYLPTPMTTKPSTPTIPCLQQPSPEPVTSNNSQQQAQAIQPYLSFGFKVEDAIVYISDTSHIPEDKWAVLETRPSGKSLPVLVLDCLRLRPHTSHVGLADSVESARRMGASRTYLTGFSHDVAHEEYVTIGEAVGGIKKETTLLTEAEKNGLAMIKDGKDFWLRPAHDGLRVFVESDGHVWDETYVRED